ncbi:hypothetical protein CPC08DRAFT_767017 [Agrocybe pediades]|nr:hypothetical protein CPC08DRAFT_767017 [Agrocybe pediades]
MEREKPSCILASRSVVKRKNEVYNVPARCKEPGNRSFKFQRVDRLSVGRVVDWSLKQSNTAPASFGPTFLAASVFFPPSSQLPCPSTNVLSPLSNSDKGTPATSPQARNCPATSDRLRIISSVVGRTTGYPALMAGENGGLHSTDEKGDNEGKFQCIIKTSNAAGAAHDVVLLDGLIPSIFRSVSIEGWLRVCLRDRQVAESWLKRRPTNGQQGEIEKSAD